MPNERRAWIAPFALAASAILNCGALWGASTPDLGSLLHTGRLLQSGYRGQGVRVGVTSTGASNYAALSRQQILPADVTLLGSHPDDGDEGDWMMQVVHQIAPRAQLAFCPGGEQPQTVDCARELVTRFHADIVVDDLNPMPVFEYPTLKAAGLAELARQHPDVLFFTGAGNNGGGYYEGRWTPTPVDVEGTHYLAQDFGRSLGEGSDSFDAFLLPPGADAQLLLGTTANPTGAPAQCDANNPEVRLALFDANGSVLGSVSGRCPLLQLKYRNSGFQPRRVRAAVLLPAGSQVGAFAFKLVAIHVGNGTSPVTLSHRTGGGAGNSATAAGLIAVAAVDPNSGWRNRFLVEDFANAGPQCLYEAQAGTGGLLPPMPRPASLQPSTRWSVLAQPQCFQQPAFVVPDRAVVAMSGPAGVRYEPFIGNSSAGPAAAAVAALLRSARIPAGRVIELLEHTAIAQTDIPGWDAHYGYGLIDADAAAVAAGVLAAVRSADVAASRPISASSPTTASPDKSPPFRPTAAWRSETPVLFRPTAVFERDRLLSEQAQRGNREALTNLADAAKSGDVDAQTWLAMYQHGVGNDTEAAHWALAAADQGEPIAQGFLGSMYNRGWGVPEDPRAAQSWWLRAARAGVASALFNLGTTVAHGRGGPSDPVLGYALMRAASSRGMQFSPMDTDIAEIRSSLKPQQLQAAEIQAARFAADPVAVPAP